MRDNIMTFPVFFLFFALLIGCTANNRTDNSGAYAQNDPDFYSAPIKNEEQCAEVRVPKGWTTADNDMWFSVYAPTTDGDFNLIGVTELSNSSKQSLPAGEAVKINGLDGVRLTNTKLVNGAYYDSFEYHLLSGNREYWLYLTCLTEEACDKDKAIFEKFVRYFRPLPREVQLINETYTESVPVQVQEQYNDFSAPPATWIDQTILVPKGTDKVISLNITKPSKVTINYQFSSGAVGGSQNTFDGLFDETQFNAIGGHMQCGVYPSHQWWTGEGNNKELILSLGTYYFIFGNCWGAGSMSGGTDTWKLNVKVTETTIKTRTRTSFENVEKVQTVSKEICVMN